MGRIKGNQPHRRLQRRGGHPEPRWLDVALIRQRSGFTRAEFARRFGLSVATVRHWENRTRSPRGAALVLAHVIWREPGAVIRAVAQARTFERDLLSTDWHNAEQIFQRRRGKA